MPNLKSTPDTGPLHFTPTYICNNGTACAIKNISDATLPLSPDRSLPFEDVFLWWVQAGDRNDTHCNHTSSLRLAVKTEGDDERYQLTSEVLPRFPDPAAVKSAVYEAVNADDTVSTYTFTLTLEDSLGNTLSPAPGGDSHFDLPLSDYLERIATGDEVELYAKC